MKKMKITIHKDGTQNVEALQCTGEDCILFTQQLEKRLGTPLGEREFKPEYYETESETERQHERASVTVDGPANRGAAGRGPGEMAAGVGWGRSGPSGGGIGHRRTATGAEEAETGF